MTENPAWLNFLEGTGDARKRPIMTAEPKPLRSGRTVLFSTFEPSGDALAATAIRALLADHPGVKVYALGGPRMEAAGAELLEHTTQHGSMFLDTLVHAWSHRKRLARLRRWLAAHRIDALVPVDSPAGNWSICSAVRRAQHTAKIIHLVAPQVWSWARWRVHRLRRLTDHVLCLLPFEPQWLGSRGVRSTFVGHPVYDAPAETGGRSPDLPEGSPRLALLPGSRRGEIIRNWPTMLEAFCRLRENHPLIVGAVAALDAQIEELLRDVTARLGRAWPSNLALVAGQTDAVLRWCDVALVASGTATLEVAAHLKPMVVMYNMRRITAALAALLVRSRTFALPNLVSEWAGQGRAVPELIPHFGRVEPVVRRLEELLGGPEAARRQRALLAEVNARFASHSFSRESAHHLAAALGLRPAAVPIPASTSARGR